MAQLSTLAACVRQLCVVPGEIYRNATHWHTPQRRIGVINATRAPARDVRTHVADRFLSH